MRESETTVTTAFRIPKDTYAKAKTYCQERGYTLGGYLASVIEADMAHRPGVQMTLDFTNEPAVAE